MRNHYSSQRVDRLKAGDLPVPRENEFPGDYEPAAKDAEHEGELEALEQARHFLEEGDVFHFFGRCAPGYVDFEEVGQQRLRYVKGDAAEEDGEEEEPFEIFVNLTFY